MSDTYLSDGPQHDLVVPADFVAPTPDVDPETGIPLPEYPPRLRTQFDPEGKGEPTDSMTLAQNVRGTARTGTVLGALYESSSYDIANQVRALGNPEDQETLRGRQIVQRAIDRNMAKMKQAESQLYEDIAYDLSPGRITPSSVAGTIIGSMLSPESFGGLSGLLVRQFPKLAVQPVVRTAADAALVNTLTDPVVQGLRLSSGTAKEYEPLQTLAAPVVGAAVGGGIAGAVVGGGRLARALGRGADAPEVPGDARPGVEPVPEVVTPEPAPAVKATQQESTLQSWRDASPHRDFDSLYVAAPQRQDELVEAAADIARETGASFDHRGVKKRETAEAKLTRKPTYRGPQDLTDVVRGAFLIDTARQADDVVAKLAAKFEVLDEGWTTSPLGYTHRKALVRFEDGTIGEVQITSREVWAAKKNGGDGLYEEWRGLPPDDPRRTELRDRSFALYAGRSALDANASLGSEGNPGNLASNSSFGIDRPASATSASSTRIQAPLTNAQDSALPVSAQSAGTPSQTQNFIGSTSGRNIETFSASGNGAVADAAAFTKRAASALTGIPGVDAAPASSPGRPAGVFLFDAATLQTDAKRFQFKDNGDEFGVTTALKGVTRWDPAKANQLIVWQDESGQLFVADGHQRSGLARRLIGQGNEQQISIPGILYRASDGFTAEDVRAIAAAKNIAEGSGSPIDGAKVLRTRPELLDGSMPISRTEARQSFELARLNDESFGMAVNEVVPYQYAAVVGRYIPDDGPRQVAAMQALARFEPRNETEASILVQRVAQAELAKAEAGAQGSMFDFNAADSTAGEEMRIVARVIADLKKDKALFSRVVQNAGRIEETGSTIRRDTAQAVAQDSELFARAVTSGAYTKGPLRDALVNAAKEVRDGTRTVNDAARDVLAAARRAAENDVRSGAGDSRSDEDLGPTLFSIRGRKRQLSLAAQRELDGQLSFEGADRPTLKQRLDAEAAKPMRGGDRDLGADSLFGDGRAQQDMFAAGRAPSPTGRGPDTDLAAALAESRFTANRAALGKDGGGGWRIKKDGDGYIVMRMPDAPGVPPTYYRPPKGESWGVEEAVAQGIALSEKRAADQAKTSPLGGALFRQRGPVQATQPPDQVVQGRPVNQGTQQAAPDAPLTRLEDLSRNLVEAFQVTSREGRVAPGARGQYKIEPAVIRVRSVSDFDTVAHEVGHALHLDTDNRAAVDAIVRANGAELTPLGAGNARGNAEAFAELFRLYVTNKPFAERNYPSATAALETFLRTKPDQFKAVEDVRGALDALHLAPSSAVVAADTISAPPPGFTGRVREAFRSDRDPSGQTTYSALDALYAATIDQLHPIYKAVSSLIRVAKDNGRTVNLLPADDAYVLSRLSAGSDGVAKTMLNHGVIPFGEHSPAGASFKDAVTTAIGRFAGEKEFNDFGAYLVSRRAVAEYQRFFAGEIPNPPHKLSLGDHQTAIAQFEAQYPSFREAASMLYEFQANHLKRLFDKGMVTQDYYDKASQRVDYVPFQRDMADFSETPKVGGGLDRNLRYSVMKAFRGSQRPVINPLESIVRKVHDLEIAIARNDSVVALAKLADEAGPGSGAIAERIPNNQLRPQRVDVIEALRAAGTKAGVDEADLNAQILQIEDLLGDSTWATLFKQEPIKEGGEPIIFGWQNGERFALRLADGRFGREMYHAFTALNDVERNWFFRFLQLGQQLLRAGVTKAPEFIMVNFVRDQLTATGTAGRKYIPFLSAARGAYDVILNKPDAVTYAGMGGLTGGQLTHALERAGFGGSAKTLVIDNVTKKAAQVFELSEASTRVGLFRSYKKQAEEMGFDDYNAALYATFKSVDYIDFRKAGSQMQWVRRWVPFLNAALQGTDREARALADLPVLEAKRFRGETLSPTELDRLKDARVSYVRIALMGAVLGTGLAVMNQDKPEWVNAGRWLKNNNFLFKVGDQWFSIPKPFGFIQSITNAFERAAEYAIRKDPQLGVEWLTSSAEGMLPPLHNPFIALAYDLPANWNRFRGRNIVPYHLQGVDPSQQYSAFTSEFSKTVGAGTGWSPMKIDYFMTNLGGGMARDFLFTTDQLMGRDRPQKQIYDYPVLRRFTKNLARGNEATTAFYKLVSDKNGEFEQAENAYRVMVRNGERAKAETFLRNLPEDRRVWTVLNTLGFSTAEKRLHPMYSAREQISVASGVINQLNVNNLLKEGDLDRRDMTRSRRDATPIILPAGTRAKLIEEFQSLQFVQARNAMVAIEAKGTTGLQPMDAAPILDRIKMLSPEAFDEYQERVAKKGYAFGHVRQQWPEAKRRILVDGEHADLSDLVPADAQRRRRRRSRALAE